MGSASAMSFAVECPAKVNLHLSVTGKRDDGFHELVSLVARTGLTDRLELRWETGAGYGGAGADSLTVRGADVGPPADNLVLRAAAALRRRAPPEVFRGRAVFTLHKRIPAGAGFGGGSSDAVGALRLLGAAALAPIDDAILAAAAAEVGSDCPLFLRPGLVRMEGRGERLGALPAAASARLHRQRVFLFKPPFGVATAWAYGALAGDGAGYDDAAHARARLDAWARGDDAMADLLYNRFSAPVARKYVTLGWVVAEAQRRFGMPALMSGSGSGCFALAHADSDFAAFESFVHECWGPHAFCADTRIDAGPLPVVARS